MQRIKVDKNIKIESLKKIALHAVKDNINYNKENNYNKK